MSQHHSFMVRLRYQSKCCVITDTGAEMLLLLVARLTFSAAVIVFEGSTYSYLAPHGKRSISTTFSQDKLGQAGASAFGEKRLFLGSGLKTFPEVAHIPLLPDCIVILYMYTTAIGPSNIVSNSQSVMEPKIKLKHRFVVEFGNDKNQTQP